MRAIRRLLLPLLLFASCAAPAAAPPGGTAPQAAAQATGPERFAAEIQRFEEADRQRAPAPGGVVFVGSSTIRLWNTLAQDFPGVQVINRGFGGSELSDVLHYLDQTVLRHAPRMVLVYGGDNDLFTGKTPQRVLADYQEIVRRIHARHPQARVGFISVKPSPSRWHLADRVRGANALVRDFAARDPRLFYVDVFTPMLGPDGMPPRDLFVEDMLHMNPKGYAVWRTAVAPYLR